MGGPPKRPLHGLYEAFGKAVCGWMIWGRTRVFVVVGTQEVRQLRRCELRAVITNNLCRKAITGKYVSKNLNGP